MCTCGRARLCDGDSEVGGKTFLGYPVAIRRELSLGGNHDSGVSGGRNAVLGPQCAKKSGSKDKVTKKMGSCYLGSLV